MKVINLKTEYLNNPLGIDIVCPNITWNVVGEDIRHQTAFEITYRVNGGEEKSVTKETSSTHYEFEESLKSRDHVTYKVRQNPLVSSNSSILALDASIEVFSLLYKYCIYKSERPL